MAKLQLEQFLPYRLNRIASAVSQDFRSVYGPHHDLTIPEWRVLATLGQFEEMGAKAIGRHSAMHKTKVSRAVRALEERRWLKRRESEEDRREEILTLTALGRKVYLDIIPKAVAFERRILDELGPEAKPLLKVLERLERIFGAD
ncbi:MarR family winged helix-turn-helix transcriptional regulator [Microvirga lotononidis]|uniref:Transcriptional regulator n=1 Tax=Microvirga lotononidis TaxID=864069 RepID=I4YLD0_9HYPH|nr:MarR family winged helix-turn-helix transcriptional regulator [Microvirga lotononidis]EIM24772.1 transcriptional regulator [Microvirga lotononidis]WQO25421.1 MarR family winged helix-turn-helix transcriptional regulator [Microvirga lotononidis]